MGGYDATLNLGFPIQWLFESQVHWGIIPAVIWEL